MTRALLTCRGVTRTYGAGDTAFTAVRGVTCEVEPNSRIALTGPSGSGKSTLLHLMAGLDTATSGSIDWPVFGGHPSARADLVGMVFQGPSLIPALSVVENVGLPMILSGMDTTDADMRARAALQLLELDPLVDDLPDELSSGQAQRVAVARVLAARPRLILADEPTGQLDRGNAATVIDVLLTVCEELGAALVVATHDRLVSDHLSIQWAMHEGVLCPRDHTDPADQR